MTTLSRWLAPAVLAAGLGFGAMAPAPVHAQDSLTRVLVSVADVIFNDGQPYYRYGNHGYNDRLVVARDQYGRPVYYRQVPYGYNTRNYNARVVYDQFGRRIYDQYGRRINYSNRYSNYRSGPPYGNAYGYYRNGRGDQDRDDRDDRDDDHGHDRGRHEGHGHGRDHEHGDNDD